MIDFINSILKIENFESLYLAALLLNFFCSNIVQRCGIKKKLDKKSLDVIETKELDLLEDNMSYNNHSNKDSDSSYSNEMFDKSKLKNNKLGKTAFLKKMDKPNNQNIEYSIEYNNLFKKGVRFNLYIYFYFKIYNLDHKKHYKYSKPISKQQISLKNIKGNKNYEKDNIEVNNSTNILGKKTERKSKIEANKSLNLNDMFEKTRHYTKHHNLCHICNLNNCELKCLNCNKYFHKFCACINLKKINNWKCSDCNKTN